MSFRLYSDVITLDTVVEAAAYATGELLGGKQTITDAVLFEYGGAVLSSVVIVDLAAQEVALDLIFFDSNPGATTFTENAALTIVDADLDRVVAVVSVLASDYVSFADNSVAVKGNIGQVIRSNIDGAEDLYLAVVVRGAPTYAAVGDIRIRLGFLQD
ncbi:hypothetical protein LCGC14_1141930 [marine sediment metagenome]|uniref:Uncharacterized protein n=1 Tax=marine sediment metagenome TaxID=412755 RepID=A0A0F9PG60_9ZZZZ